MSQFLFKKVHLVIKDVFFHDIERMSFLRAKELSDMILLFIEDVCPMLWFFEAKEHLINPYIFEYHDVEPHYVVETVKYIETNDELRKYVAIEILC